QPLRACVGYEPGKHGATLLEALALVLVVGVIVRAKPLRRANIEGPRRTVLFFAVDYALRFVFAFVVGGRLASGDIVGLMGFGYLLPTLLAVKMAQKSSVALVLLPAAKVSAAAFAVGTLVGFGATLFDRRTETRDVLRAMPSAPADARAAAMWTAALALEREPAGGAPAAFAADEIARAADEATRGES